MTLVLSESDVESLIDMKEVVSTVEEAFRRKGLGEATNFMRTRSRGPSSVLNVMHASLAYLHRGGLKAYMSTRTGSRFVVLLFDTSDSSLLAVMAADMLGRYRTGAASGVATRHLYGKNSGTLAVFGSGRQALTQVLAVREVVSLSGVKIWSPHRDHSEAFASRLASYGIEASTHGSPDEAVAGADIATTITASREPFLTERMAESISHLNVCGGNVTDHAEVTVGALGSFDSIVVDDIPQARVEYGDLIRAVDAGRFAWEDALDLADIVAGQARAKGRTLFKSGGAALEDVALASMLYDKALKSGRAFAEVELV